MAKTRIYLSKKRSVPDIRVGDKVIIKNAALKPKKGEVFEVVGVALVSIKNSRGRVSTIHVSNIELAPD
jgi:ribosomal protein L19